MQDVRRLIILGVALLAIAIYVIATTGSHLTRLVMVGAIALYAVGVCRMHLHVRHEQHRL